MTPQAYLLREIAFRHIDIRRRDKLPSLGNHNLTINATFYCCAAIGSSARYLNPNE